jgi:hypothetical protein
MGEKPPDNIGRGDSVTMKPTSTVPSFPPSWQVSEEYLVLELLTLSSTDQLLIAIIFPTNTPDTTTTTPTTTTTTTTTGCTRITSSHSRLIDGTSYYFIRILQCMVPCGSHKDPECIPPIILRKLLSVASSIKCDTDGCAVLRFLTLVVQSGYLRFSNVGQQIVSFYYSIPFHMISNAETVVDAVRYLYTITTKLHVKLYRVQKIQKVLHPTNPVNDRNNHDQCFASLFLQLQLYKYYNPSIITMAREPTTTSYNTIPLPRMSTLTITVFSYPSGPSQITYIISRYHPPQLQISSQPLQHVPLTAPTACIDSAFKAWLTCPFFLLLPFGTAIIRISTSPPVSYPATTKNHAHDLTNIQWNLLHTYSSPPSTSVLQHATVSPASYKSGYFLL